MFYFESPQARRLRSGLAQTALSFRAASVAAIAWDYCNADPTMSHDDGRLKPRHYSDRKRMAGT